MNTRHELQIRLAEERDITAIAQFNINIALETENIRLKPEVIDAGVRNLMTHPERGFYIVAEALAE